MTNSIIGIDVSKAKIDVAWLKDPVGLKIKSKVFDNNPAGFAVLMDWITHNIDQPVNNIQCVMEATGIYHEPLAFWLHDRGFCVSIENPAHVKNFARSLGVAHKTDKKDSFVLARYGSVVKRAHWIPEAKKHTGIKDLIGKIGSAGRRFDSRRKSFGEDRVFRSHACSHRVHSFDDSAFACRTRQVG